MNIGRALRSLARTPGFTIIGVVTIAIGVGATTAVFSLADAVLMRLLPVPAAQNVVSVTEDRSGLVMQGPEGMRVGFPRYEAYREATREVFADLAAHEYAIVSLSVKGEAVSAPAALVSRNYFDVLGLRPALGTFFSGENDATIVLSHGLWRSRFAGDRDVLGELVLLDGAPYTIIGVAPETFHGTAMPFTHTLWAPIHGYAGGAADRSVGMFGRLAPGVTADRAQTVVTAAALGIPPAEPQTKVRGAELAVLTGLALDMRGPVRTFVSVLFATALFVLLIAAANLAGMQLTRAALRQREIAVQLAIGAGRARIVRQLLTEAVLLFLAGGIGGILIAVAATNLFNRIPSPISVPLLLNVETDLRVLAFALLLALVTGVLFGLAPALSSTKLDLVTSLKDGARGVTRGTRGRTWFVAGQISVAVVLLVVAGLFIRSLQKALTTDVGFDADKVVVGTVNLAPLGYDQDRSRIFFDELTRRIRAMPDVQGVALSQNGLLSGTNSSSDVTNGLPDSPRDDAGINVVDTAFFRTLNMPVVAGRGFTTADRAGAPMVTVINRTLAEFLWPGQNAVGRLLHMDDEKYRVVGVVANAKYNTVTEEARPYAFFPVEQDYPTRMVLHVRTTAVAGDILERMRRATNEIEPAVALDAPRLMSSLVEATVFPQRFGASVIGLFGFIGLLLAALGVYGVLSAQVAQRKREFGIRVAIGASERDVLGAVVKRGIKLAVVGGVVGILLAAAATRVLGSVLYGIEPLDPATFIAVPVVLGVVAVLASYIPAWKATRVPPTEALRAD